MRTDHPAITDYWNHPAFRPPTDDPKAALRLAAEVFRYYGELHAAKQTPDGRIKAGANWQLAGWMEDALIHLEAGGGDGDEVA